MTALKRHARRLGERIKGRPPRPPYTGAVPGMLSG
jgi:hypothetical protein